MKTLVSMNASRLVVAVLITGVSSIATASESANYVQADQGGHIPEIVVTAKRLDPAGYLAADVQRMLRAGVLAELSSRLGVESTDRGFVRQDLAAL